MVLSIPMAAVVESGELTMKRGERHFYRVLWSEDLPLIRFAFSPDAIVKDYERTSSDDCAY